MLRLASDGFAAADREETRAPRKRFASLRSKRKVSSKAATWFARETEP